jgi:hypothetical protein
VVAFPAQYIGLGSLVTSAYSEAPHRPKLAASEYPDTTVTAIAGTVGIAATAGIAANAAIGAAAILGG